MPGPMSIPNGHGHTIVKVIVGHDKKNQPIFGELPVSKLNGEQRAYLASRRNLNTGKTAVKKNK